MVPLSWSIDEQRALSLSAPLPLSEQNFGYSNHGARSPKTILDPIGKEYFEIKLYQNLTVKMDKRTMATKPPGNCIHNNGGRRHHFLGAIFWRARLTQAQRPFTA